MSSTNEAVFDKTCRIPKRKFDETSADVNGRNHYGTYANIETPVLANSYYNYYENPGLFGPWQQGSVYAQYPTAGPVEPITQNIYNTLSHIKEKPKNYRKNIFKETVPDVDDVSLPKELTAMFQPLYCKLCTAQLSSNVMAKLHYKSKNHEKKIKKFLVEYSQRTGEPLHKRAKVAGMPKEEDDKNPQWFHCDVCDLPLTGKMHAESHYMGKNHQKALLGQKPPAGKGYYNGEGKWVRQAGKKTATLAPGEDTFGMAFKTKEQQEKIAGCMAAAAAGVAPSKFHCNICNVSATCQEQIDMHFNGQKHQKKMRQKGLQPHFTTLPSTTQADATEENLASKSTDINLAVYRTPSGDFYCPTCNLALNSEIQFKVHLKSKGHMKKSQHKRDGWFRDRDGIFQTCCGYKLRIISLRTDTAARLKNFQASI